MSGGLDDDIADDMLILKSQEVWCAWRSFVVTHPPFAIFTRVCRRRSSTCALSSRSRLRPFTTHSRARTSTGRLRCVSLAHFVFRLICSEQCDHVRDHELPALFISSASRHAPPFTHLISITHLHTLTRCSHTTHTLGSGRDVHGAEEGGLRQRACQHNGRG
jgi:hypothetical protein